MEKWATCGKKNLPLSRKDLIDKVGTRLLTVIVDFLPTATQPFGLVAFFLGLWLFFGLVALGLGLWGMWM